MRYRALDASGDMTFGQSQANFLVNSPAAVAQAVQTRLGLLTGEWFLDTTEGTPYMTEVVGTGTQQIYDQAIKARILGTQGAASITSYSSSLDPITRKLTVSATVLTIYSSQTVGVTL